MVTLLKSMSNKSNMKSNYLKFVGFGHLNISAAHLTTMEFTSDKEISPRGDCLLACNVIFDLKTVQNFLKNVKRIKITISADLVSDYVECLPNQQFNDLHELVIRMSAVQTCRTFGFNATKGARMLSRELVQKLKDPKQQVVITFEEAIEKR